MRTRKRVARVDDRLSNLTQRAWEQSRNIIRSPKVRDRQIGNDGLAAVQRIAPDEVIVHRPLRPQVGDRAGLVDIKMRWGTEDPIAQHPTAFGMGLRGAQCEVWRSPDLWCAGQALRQPRGACGSPEGGTQ